MTCVCWDGPFSAADPTPVSVRCDVHAHVPPADGHLLMDAGTAIAAAVVDAAGRVAELERRFPGKLPQQAPSEHVCVTRCGSRCCKTPGMAVFLRSGEMRRLRTHAEQIGARLPVEHAGRPNGADLWRYRFADTADRCVFLDDHGLCRIYADRPNACRVFPSRPVAGCLVWPDPDAADGGVLGAAA